MENSDQLLVGKFHVLMMPVITTNCWIDSQHYLLLRVAVVVLTNH
ncbi:unnamed protein product [Schistosoma mattheei]|uniref:Uncharacterized protein n=1 Tax=Schistosoma mattheei TaxID=31246 RepID=A0A183Q3T8_9TREM|nr:unnamed protein product [Schistosoma mattheei]